MRYAGQGSLIGATLGPYRILRELGRGGMAIVYEAYQPSLNRRVAIKVLPPQMAFDAAFVARFVQEARAAAQLRHPNIVTIHDVGEVNGLYFIVMEKLEGEPLSELIRRTGRLASTRAAKILAQIAAALDYAHAHGIVHRDIKPGNIIVGPGDQAILTDFGIARAADSSHLTRTGMLMGTPEYMSPEQASGQPAGPASDIYSLGIVLYEMLTGRAPFRADSTPALLHQHVYAQPAPVRSHAPGVAAEVDAVLARALAKEPARRYRTAGDMATALQRAAALPAGPARRDRSQEPTGLLPTTSASPRKAIPQPVWYGAAGVVLLLLLLLLWPRPPTPPTPASPTAILAQATRPAPAVLLSTVPRALPGRPSPTPTVTRPTRPQAIARHAINVYAGPHEAYGKLGQTSPGEILDILAASADGLWWRVCCVAGEPVWIKAELAEPVGSTADVPVMVVPPPSPSPAKVGAGPTAAPQPTAASQRAAPAPAIATSPPIATVVPAPTPTRPPPACRRESSLPPVTLLTPVKDKTCNGPVRFIWQWQHGLQSGEAFEIHIWPELQQNRNAVKRTRQTSVVVDIRQEVRWINWNDKPHRWEVVVVCEATGRWISAESEPRLFYFWPLEPFDPNNPDVNCK